MYRRKLEISMENIDVQIMFYLIYIILVLFWTAKISSTRERDTVWRIRGAHLMN